MLRPTAPPTAIQVVWASPAKSWESAISLPTSDTCLAGDGKTPRIRIRRLNATMGSIYHRVMEFRIDGNPDYGELTVGMSADETLTAESGAMSRMSAEMDIKSRMMGGFLSALGRKLFGGESLFVGSYSAPQGGWVSLSPSLPGEVLHRKMDGGTYILSAGAFLACSPGVQLRTRFGGFRYLFSGKGGFFLEVGGSGDLFYNSYGAVVEKSLDGTLTVDLEDDITQGTLVSRDGDVVHPRVRELLGDAAPRTNE